MLKNDLSISFLVSATKKREVFRNCRRRCKFIRSSVASVKKSSSQPALKPLNPPPSPTQQKKKQKGKKGR